MWPTTRPLAAASPLMGGRESRSKWRGYQDEAVAALRERRASGAAVELHLADGFSAAACRHRP